MSVEYSAGVAFGFKLTGDEMNMVRQAFEDREDWDKLDEISDMFIIDLNSWGDGSDGVIFGLSFFRMSDCGAQPLFSIEPNPGQIYETMNAYHEYIEPILGNKEPNRYIYCQCY
ncbi:MAG: hypothetical protein Q4E51_08675 [Lachnospiraceae bacterium]|nr:hypothetical protein [Lachnospiraceae bacterium]